VRHRDSQRQKLYDAEQAIRDGLGGDLKGRSEALAFVADVTASKEWKKLVRRHAGWKTDLLLRGVRVTFARRKAKATWAVGANHIHLAAWAVRQRAAILHELAHLLNGDLMAPFHGPVFTGLFLKLVAVFMSDIHAAVLTDSFARHGVKVAKRFPRN
jgi:putative metallohydrolase (TIGR04338 family)